MELLWKKIDYPDKKVVSELLLSLSYLGFVAKEFQAARIKLMVEAEIGDLTWNAKTLSEIPRHSKIDELIRESFNEEDKIELVYRKGRIYHHLNSLDQALSFYLLALKKGEISANVYKKTEETKIKGNYRALERGIINLVNNSIEAK